MIPRYTDDRVAVYDDFLSSEQQEKILRHLDRAKFRAVMPDAWGRAYRLCNGSPLVGQEIVSEKLRVPDKSAYPTDTALDLLIQRMFDCKDMLARIVGPHGSTWTYFTMCPHVYPAGSGLGWHTDAHCAGAYVYYAHRQWGIHWGGELAVAYGEQDCAPYDVSSRGILHNEPLESALRDGMGYFFSPVPNRMIFIRRGTPHMIKSVEPACGDNLRVSLSGFFLNADPSTDG